MEENDLIKEPKNDEIIDINSMFDFPINNTENTSTQSSTEIIEPIVDNNMIMETPTEEVLKPLPDVSITPELPSDPNAVVTSGTATEEEILNSNKKENVEVLDEYEIKQDLVKEDKKYKKNAAFIIIIVLLIVAFIVMLPFIAKKIGL